MSEYQKLLERKRALDAEIEAAREKEVATALATIKELVVEYELTERDVFGGRVANVDRVKKAVVPKYRDPGTGKTWTGRGKPPRWITSGKREDFLIAA